MCDRGAIGVFEVRDRDREFLIEIHDLEPFRRGDGEAGLKEIDSVCFAGDVKIVEIAKKLRVPFSKAKAGARADRGLLIDGFEHFKSRVDPFTFFVDYQGTIFHATRGKESDVAITREFLGGAAGRDVRGRRRGRVTRDGADGIKVVGYKGFVGDEEEQGEFLEDSDLGDAIGGNGLEGGQMLTYNRGRN